MRKKYILERWKTAGWEITPHLVDYVDWCLDKDGIGNKLTKHHILPSAKTLPFSDVSDLNKHPENLSRLSYYNHYIAHYKLALAIDHIATLSAFCRMHSGDVQLGRLSNVQLIRQDDYAEIYNRRNKKISEWRLELIVSDCGKLVTRASAIANTVQLSAETLAEASERMSGANNIIHRKGVLQKMRTTKISRNADALGAKKAAKTMSTPRIVDGQLITIYQQTGKKISETVTMPINDGNGNVTTIAKRRNSITHQKLRHAGRWYRVLNVFDNTFISILPACEVRKLSPALPSKSKEDFLGKSEYGKQRLIKTGRQHLIGAYVEILQSKQILDIQNPNHNPTE
jgi:hypothetical protein